MSEVKLDLRLARKLVFVMSLAVVSTFVVGDTASAHKDPPANPQRLVEVFLVSALIQTDGDTFFGGDPGEVFVKTTVKEAGHPPAAGFDAISAQVSVDAPPAAVAVYGNLIYSHIECDPIEKLTLDAAEIIDDDGLLGTDILSTLAAGVNLPAPPFAGAVVPLPGAFTVTLRATVVNLGIVPACEPQVGGVAELAEAEGAPLEAPDSSGSNTGLIAGIVAAIATGGVSLGGAAWYARRRLTSR